MANIPNFLDVNRKKIEFFSASNIIRSKGNIVAGPGPVLPFPSPTPTNTPPPPSPTPTPTASLSVFGGIEESFCHDLFAAPSF